MYFLLLKFYVMPDVLTAILKTDMNYLKKKSDTKFY